MALSRSFSRPHLEALARSLVDTAGGLTHSELSSLFTQHHFIDSKVQTPKLARLFNAFAHRQNLLNSNQAILRFVEDAVSPARFIGRREEFESFREQVNQSLSFIGVAIGEDGHPMEVTKARTLTDAERRAKELRSDLASRGVHHDVLQFCRAELIADDYFHAVLEATKSIAQKMRDRTGLTDDGSVLVDHVFGGQNPLLVINDFRTKSERTEQSGFCNLLKGVFGMFRNPTAHEPRVLWSITKEDAEDLLSLVSLVHRRVDGARMPPRV